MPSHLIIGQPSKTLVESQKIAPFPLKPDIDCLILDNQEESLKISQVRQIKEFLTKKPYHHDHQIVLLDQAHRLTIPAQNALLKTLEEPPEHAVIILTTAYPDRLLPTIISRCQIHSTHSKVLERNTSDFETLINSLKSKNTGQIITLAQELSYPKTKAQDICQQAIWYFHEQINQKPDFKFAANARLAQKTLDRIEKNVDPRLSIEHFLIHILI